LEQEERYYGFKVEMLDLEVKEDGAHIDKGIPTSAGDPMTPDPPFHVLERLLIATGLYPTPAAAQEVGFRAGFLPSTKRTELC
jgi:hypothetical protein